MPVQLVFRSPEGERVVTLDRPLVVGRDAACDVAIATVRLSRRHAEFAVGPDGVTVRDLGSKNGIFVNGVAVEETVLKPGDRVLLGDVSVSLMGKDAATTARTMMPAPVLAGPIDLDKTSLLPSAAQAGLSAPAAVMPAGPLPAPVTAPVPPLKSRLGAYFGLNARVIALGIGAGVLAYLVGVWPSAALADSAAARDAEARATTIVRLLVAENRPPLAAGQPLALTVRSAMQEPGVRAAMIIGPQGRVLSPPERLNTTVATLTGLGAVDAIRDLTLAHVGGEVHAASAIAVGDRWLGVAWLIFDPAYASDTRRALMLVRLASAVAALVIGMAGAMLIWRMLAGRLTAFAEDLDLAVSGRHASLTERYGIPALGRPIEAINFLLERKPASASMVQTPLAPRLPSGLDEPREVASSGTVTLDGSFVVREVDAEAASLLGATADMLVGRHVLEAANRLLVDVIIDCLGDLGSSTSASRDASGPVARVTASRSSPGGPITLTLSARREA